MTETLYEPKLRVKASGLGGSGYRIPTDDGRVVPGVTTVTGALPAPGITQWAVDNTAAYAVANLDRLYEKTEEQGYRYLRWYWNRKVDYDDPETDIHNYHTGVLNDAGELGTLTHEWITSHLLGDFEPALTRPEQTGMIEAFLDWESQHEIEVLAAETTVYNPTGYAGTLDFILKVDGVPTLLDVKTSRAVRESHVAQLAALGAAPVLMREVADDSDGGVGYITKKWGTTYWKEDVVPSFSQYAVLQVRPEDIDNQGTVIPPFCHFHTIEQARIDVAYDAFLGALEVRKGLKALKDVEKALEDQF